MLLILIISTISFFFWQNRVYNLFIIRTNCDVLKEYNTFLINCSVVNTTKVGVVNLLQSNFILTLVTPLFISKVFIRVLLFNNAQAIFRDKVFFVCARFVTDVSKYLNNNILSLKIRNYTILQFKILMLNFGAFLANYNSKNGSASLYYFLYNTQIRRGYLSSKSWYFNTFRLLYILLKVIFLTMIRL